MYILNVRPISNNLVLTKLNGAKYNYVSLKIQLNIKNFFINKCKTVLFLAIQFSLSSIFFTYLNVKSFLFQQLTNNSV